MSIVQTWACFREASAAGQSENQPIAIPRGLQLSVVFQRPEGARTPSLGVAYVTLAVLLDSTLKVDRDSHHWTAQLQVDTDFKAIGHPQEWRPYLDVCRSKT